MIYAFYLNVFQGFHVKPTSREEKLQLPETGHGRLFSSSLISFQTNNKHKRKAKPKPKAQNQENLKSI